MRITLAAFLIAASTTSSLAQHLPPAPPRVASPAATARRIPVPDDPSGAIVGSAVGELTLGFATAMAYHFMNPCHDEGCAWNDLGVGVMVGFPLGAAVGAHLGNGRRGLFLADVAASLVASALSRALVLDARSGLPMLCTTLIAQAATATIVERTTGAGHAPRDSITGSP